MEVTHIKKPFKRSYTLKINTEGNLTITTNATFSNSKVKLLVQKHASWIEKTRAKILKQQSKLKKSKKSYIEGEIFNVLGVSYRLIFRDSARKYPKAFLEDEFIVIDQGLTQLNQEQIKLTLAKFFKTLLYEYIENRCVHYLYIYGLAANKISIKKQSTRWGSCSHKKNLNFNLALIFCPLEMIDYVIVHEICHLKEMNHSKRFWDLVEKEFSHHKAIRKWFKENGPEVMGMI
jgi:predicted metal-dependent hydrolase